MKIRSVPLVASFTVTSPLPLSVNLSFSVPPSSKIQIPAPESSSMFVAASIMNVPLSVIVLSVITVPPIVKSVVASTVVN